MKAQKKGVDHRIVDDFDALKLLREALIKHLGFVKADVLILCSQKPYVKPTKEAIRKEVKSLCKSERAGDFLRLHISSHGNPSSPGICDSMSVTKNFMLTRFFQ
ncbi:hypothetical protein OROGR_012981 [Orobanche gracilis]